MACRLAPRVLLLKRADFAALELTMGRTKTKTCLYEFYADPSNLTRRT